jgi:hypothetical protein
MEGGWGASLEGAQGMAMTFEEWAKTNAWDHPNPCDVGLEPNVVRDPVIEHRQLEGLGPGQRHWWVLSYSLRARGLLPFLLLDARPMLHEPLGIRLPPGMYRLGGGPPELYREELYINAQGELLELDKAAPCASMGCDGVVLFSNSLPCFVPWESPPKERLCESCRFGMLEA